MNTGHVTVLRRGHVMMDGVFDEFKNISLKPASLAGKLVLGIRQVRDENPRHYGYKVGNLNIYKGKLSVEDMKSITDGSRCGEEGDYLAWSKSKWSLGEEVRTFDVGRKELCDK